MAQTAPQFDWESARPVDEEPQQPAATPSATDSSYPGAPLNDKQEAAPLSPALFDWESARPVESAQDFDLESAVPLKELAKDPAYLMSREQFRAYRNESKETDSAVSEFLGGIPGVIPGIASMASGAIGELGQQVAQNWYRPDKLLASLTANQNEGVRRMSLSYAKMVDYIGQNLRDMDINRQREAAYGEQLRQKMQQEGKLTGDPIKDHDMVMQALFAAKDAGEIPLTDQQMAEDEERAYQDYWRGKNFDQAIGNITDIKIAGMKATTPSMEWGARNMVTGEYVAPGKSSPDVVSMGIDPANILAAGVGSLARVNALRRAGILLGKGLGPTGEVLAKAGAAVGRGADAVTERIQLATGGQRVGEKVIGGLSPEMQAYGGVTSAAAVGYMTGGDTPLDQAMTGALALLPAVRMVGGTLRKAGTAANAGWIITREMDAGAMSAARAQATKGLAANTAIPERYAKFIRGEGRASADSTLRRVAQDQANPRLLRSLSQFGDNVGLTSAVRATDDAIGGALVGASATVPFALVAPEPEQAGNIIGMGLTLGAAGGVAGGKITRMAEMQDAMVARMLVDTQASGGNAEAFARLPHQDLVSMAGLQAFSRGKLTFKPLTTSEYRVNLDVTKRRGENSAGFYVDTADDGTSTVFINMGEPSAVAGVVAKIRPATKGGKTIEVRDKDGNSTFTYVPNESRIAVKQGDSVGVGTPLTRGTPSRLSVPEEIAHAIFSSKAMDGLPRDEMRNYINQRYKTEGVAARGREYAARIVDQEIAAGVYGAADSIDDAARDRLVEQRFTEFSQASIEDGADPLDWARDEIIAASLRASVQGIDLARLRNQSNFSRLAEQVVSSSAQALRVLGVDVDKMGRVLDPAGTFRDNPVFADPAMRRMVTKYMRDYDQWLAGMEDAGRKDKRGVRVAPSGKVQDYANSQHTVLREIKDANGNGTGVFENDVVTRGADGVVRPKKQVDIDKTEISRAAQIKSLWDAGKTVPTASTEFGKRRVNGRDIVGGPTLPKQWDYFTQFPQWIREFARQLETGRGDGRTWIADYNAIGTGSSGRYRVTNLGNIEAIIREVAFVGWQITKKNHLLATVFDMNAFRAAAKRAIDAGELGELGNNMDEVNATLLQYLDNHKNGRPGEYGIGQTKKNILNGLIGTGTAKQTAANPFYAELNPRGSVRTFRVDRLNDLRDTGRTGYNFMYEPINANMMPDSVRSPKDLTTDQILRELEENQGYLGLSTLGMREGRPVKGGAQQTRELLKRNTALNEELRRRGGPQEESDVQRILRQRGQAMPDVADIDTTKFTVAYRGGPSGKGDFPGTFVSTSQDAASQYGDVRAVGVPRGLKVLSIDDDAALQLARQYEKKYPADALNDDLAAGESPADLFMFPRPEWVKMLKQNGYQATQMGEDLFVFDGVKLKDSAGQATARTRGQAMPDGSPTLENFDAAQQATGGTLRPIADQPENAPIAGRLTPEQSASIDELQEYYRSVTPQRVKELQADAVESLASRLINKGIPVTEANDMAKATFRTLRSRVNGAMQVISGMGTSDLSRMAGTGRPAVATRKGVNPNWLTSAFEAFDTDNDLALMKAQQVARQLNKEQQAQVAAGQSVDAARASGVRSATIDQGMQFVIGEKTADQKAFGSSLREDPSAPPRVYASVVEGQKFGSQGNYNVFFEWKKDAPMVVTSHHHYGVGNGLTDIHASANIGDKNARSFGDPQAEVYDTLPSGKKVLRTRLLVGNAGAADIRAHQLMVSIPESALSGIKKKGAAGARAELNRIAISQLVGSASQGKTQSFTSKDGVPPMVAIQRNRTEAYVLNPDLKNVASITIVSNSPKETALIKKNLANAFKNNGSPLPRIKVVSAESGPSGNPGRKKITDEFFNLTGKVVYGAALGGAAALAADESQQ